jgi:hypothetical protein
MPGQDGSYGARLPVITIDIVRMTARTMRDGLPGGNSGGLCHQTAPDCGFVRLFAGSGSQAKVQESLYLERLFLVGAARFELATPSPPDWCANRAALRSDREKIIDAVGTARNNPA